MMPTPARAVDGTITINGEITDQTCKIEGKDPPYDLIVNLPRIGTTALKKVNDTAGATAFEIKLSQCSATLDNQSVKAYFEPYSTTDYGTGNLIAYQMAQPVTQAKSSIPSPATVFKAVQIQLANPDGKTIKMGVNTDTQAAKSVKVTNQAATLRYLARYVKSTHESITAGKLVSYVQYSIVYP
ncbi:fimbrial protein [Bordetella genomosp. 12]